MSRFAGRVREEHPSWPDISSVPSLKRVPRLSCGATGSGNAIIHGENALVLSALHQSLLGGVRCVYIDPPYNNGENYTHYSDDWDHAHWLRDITVRLELLRPLLRNDGSIWISIDDRELHYLKVTADRIFGRKNFVATIVWQHRTTRENRRAFSHGHEYILVYAKDARAFSLSRNRLSATPEIFLRYKNPDNDPRGPWQSVSANVQAGHATASQFYALQAPNGKVHQPPKGRCWVFSRERMEAAVARNEIWFGRDGNGVPRIKQFLKDSRGGMTPSTLWLAEEVGTTLEAKKQLLHLFPDGDVFDTPKPERLLKRIIEIATDQNDIVLDAYLGSGTTAAVAHKLNRRYVGIEQGRQVVTHCAERMRAVVCGKDGGVAALSADVLLSCGYDFYRHAET